MAKKTSRGLVGLQEGDTLYTRWNEVLTAAQRARIDSELKSKRDIPEFRWAPVSDLRIDENYQRAVSEERVWDIMRNFSWRLYQSLWIGQRPDGNLYVVDGRHRFEVARLFGPELMPTVPCEIRHTTGTREEARTFVALTEKRRRISSAQRFDAKLVYGDKSAQTISEIVARHTFEIRDPALFTTTDKDGTISSIATVERIFNAGGERLLDATLYVLRKAWNGQHQSLRGSMIGGMARCLQRLANPNLDRLAKALSVKDPFVLLGRAKRFAHHNHMVELDALAEILAEWA